MSLTPRETTNDSSASTEARAKEVEHSKGANSETHAACSEERETQRSQPLTLGEAFDFLRSFHKQAPFLFYNGNTFATIGRELSLALFSDLPPARRREVASAVAHYIAGVMDRGSMAQALNELSRSATFPGRRSCEDLPGKRARPDDKTIGRWPCCVAA